MTGPGRPPIGAVHEIRFPADLWSRIEAAASGMMTSDAAIVRVACIEWLNRAEVRSSRTQSS